MHYKTYLKIWNSSAIYYSLWSIFLLLLIIYFFFDGYKTLVYDYDFTKSDAIKFFFQFLGALLVLFGLLINYRRTDALEKQVRINEESNITDMFQKAIEHIGSDNSSIALGGIITIERIAKDSIYSNESTFIQAIDILGSKLNQSLHSYHNKNKSPEYIRLHELLFHSKEKINQHRINNHIYIKINYANNVNSIINGNENIKFEYFIFKHSCFDFKDTIFYNNCKFINCNFKLNHLNKGSVLFQDSEFIDCQFTSLNTEGGYYIESSNIFKCIFQNTHIPYLYDCDIVSTGFKNCSFNLGSFKISKITSCKFFISKNLKDEVLLETNKIKEVSGISKEQLERIRSKKPQIINYDINHKYIIPHLEDI